MVFLLDVKLFKTNKTSDAILLGVVLGIATAFHNGLFILQLPLLIAAFLYWTTKSKTSINLVYLGVTNQGFTFASLLPSETFREFFFSFFYQSWFHLYIALGTLFALAFFHYRSFSQKNLLILIAISLTLAAPLVNQIVHGMTFVVGELPYLDNISEIKSPYSLVLEDFKPINFYHIGKMYSLLIFFIPISFILLIYWSRPYKEDDKIFVLTFMTFAMLLLVQQYRLNYFGSFTMYLPLLMLLQLLSPRHLKKTAAIAFIIVFISYSTVPAWLLSPYQRPYNITYFKTKGIYTWLAKSCEVDPGIVLARPGDGHYIRYNTECSVISNNFIMTPEDFSHRKIAFNYLAMWAEGFLKSNHNIKYVMVMRRDSMSDSLSAKAVEELNYGLYGDLLLSSPPPGFTLISEVSGDHGAIARAFKIR